MSVSRSVKKATDYAEEKQRNQKERKNLGFSSPFVRRMSNHANIKLLNTAYLRYGL